MKKILIMAMACTLVGTAFAQTNNDEKKNKKKHQTEQCCKKKKCCKPAVVKC